MILQRPAKFSELFQVFFYVTQTNILKWTFFFLLFFVTINIGMFEVWSLLPGRGVVLTLILFLDLFLVSLYQMIIARDLDAYVQYGEKITWHDLRMSLANKSLALLLHPLLITGFAAAAIFVSAIHSLIFYIDYVGPFFYSITYAIFFLLGVFFIINFILAFGSFQLTPVLSADRELKLVDMYKELGRIYYYAWPKIILANLVQILLTLFFTALCLVIALTVIFLTLSTTAYFSDLSPQIPKLMLLFYAFPGGDVLIGAFKSSPLGGWAADYVPSYLPAEYRLPGFFMGLSMYIVALLTVTFPAAYCFVSNWFVYHIARSTLRLNPNGE